jgi:Putative capsular polysaccharide synthesis protein
VVEPEEYPALKRSFFEQWDGAPSRLNVVFAQGKTGTSSIAAGLKRARVGPVFQIHTLRPKILAKVEDEYTRRPNDSYPRHIWEAQWLREHLPSVERPWRLVTSVRDPIARIASRVFQRRSRFEGFDDAITSDGLVDELTVAFERDRKRLGAVGWDWFDFELTPVLGMSVYDFPFDPVAGVATIETEHVHALLLRGESLDKAPAALSAQFGCPIELTSENVGSQKDYGTLYREVLDRFRPPPDYVAQVYDTRLARHFYSEAERDEFRRHWTRPVPDPIT